MDAKEVIKQIVSVLTDEQEQVLKDTFNHGCWGDGDMEFLDENGKVETVSMMGYCTNDAKKGGHFQGRKVSALFRSIYTKLCAENGHRIGRYISHCNNWWGDGSGDMLFVRHELSDAFEAWAKEKD